MTGAAPRLRRASRAGEVGEECRHDAPLRGLDAGGHRAAARRAEAGPGWNRLRAVWAGLKVDFHSLGQPYVVAREVSNSIDRG